MGRNSRKIRRKQKRAVSYKGQPNDAPDKQPDIESGQYHEKNVLSPKEKFQYLEVITAKQLKLYTWCEEKVSTLATINSILLTAAVLFTDKINAPDLLKKSDNPFTNFISSHVTTNFHLFMALALILPIFISLSITLWHVRPKMRSGASAKVSRNHRSVAGIYGFKDITEYYDHLNQLSINDLCNDLVRQIYGMNKIIWRNQRSIKIAVYFDLLGLIGFIGILTCLFYD